jgi:hypothetical protein
VADLQHIRLHHRKPTMSKASAVKMTVGTRVSDRISAVALDLRTNQLGDWSCILTESSCGVNGDVKMCAFRLLQSARATVILKRCPRSSAAFFVCTCKHGLDRSM